MPDTVGLIEKVFVSVPPEYKYAVVESALPEVVVKEELPPLIDNCALTKIVICRLELFPAESVTVIVSIYVLFGVELVTETMPD